MSNYFEKVPVSGSARFLSTRRRWSPETSRRVEMLTAVWRRPAFQSSVFSLILEHHERKSVQRGQQQRQQGGGSGHWSKNFIFLESMPGELQAFSVFFFFSCGGWYRKSQTPFQDVPVMLEIVSNAVFFFVFF